MKKQPSFFWPVLILVISLVLIGYYFTLDVPVTLNRPFPLSLAAFAFGIAVIFAAGLLLLVNALAKNPPLEKPGEQEDHEHSFWEIIYTDDCKPSLSLFQFFAWTVIVLVAVLGIILLKVKADPATSADSLLNNFPLILMGLMGLSVLSPIVSGAIPTVQYSDATKKTESAGEKKPCSGVAFKEMLFLSEPRHKLSLTRFQMFCWTGVGILYYVIALGQTVLTTGAVGLYLPDFDPVLLTLMGLSQISYLGGKYIHNDALQEKVEERKKQEMVREDEAAQPVRTLPGEPKKPDIPLTESVIRREMSPGVLRWLTYDHDKEMKGKIEEKVREAAAKNLYRYYLIGPDFYYLIENGQIIGSIEKGALHKSEIIRRITREQAQIGRAEILFVE